MTFHKTGLLIRTLLLFMSFSFLALSNDALARAGGKRSFGQRSQPTMQPRNPPPTQQQNYQTPASNGRGTFMKGLAGGLAGGLLGSMLFSSFGHAAGMGGMGSGGIGFFDILLIAGIAYLAYRLWKSRQNQNRPAFAAPGGMATSSAYTGGSQNLGYFGQSAAPTVVGSHIDRGTVEDIFFRVQGAWTRQDLSLVQDVMEQEVAHVLDRDLHELKAARSINRLENISVRQVEIGDSWFEGDRELVRVRFTANLLDYTVDASTGAIKEGSASEPVKFEENWIFAKSQGRSNWQLAGIEQI